MAGEEGWASGLGSKLEAFCRHQSGSCAKGKGAFEGQGESAGMATGGKIKDLGLEAGG